MAVTITGGTCFPDIDGYDFQQGSGTLELTISDDTWVSDETTLRLAFGEDWVLIPGMESDVDPATGFNTNFQGDFEETNANEFERVSDTVIRFSFLNDGSKVWLDFFNNDVTETITIKIPAAAQNTGETQLTVTNTFQINAYEEPATSSGGGTHWPKYIVVGRDLYCARSSLELQQLLEFLETQYPIEQVEDRVELNQKPARKKVIKIPKRYRPNE